MINSWWEAQKENQNLLGKIVKESENKKINIVGKSDSQSRII